MTQQPIPPLFEKSPRPRVGDGRDDFDFLVGTWSVAHRRLRERLVGCTDWDSFSGWTECRQFGGGLGNIDDNWIDLPNAPYRAASIRLFDPMERNWSIWWADARSGRLDVPVRGRFHDGTGTFTTTDDVDGRPVDVRFVWTNITDESATWEQAFSVDSGATWETNWTMQFQRHHSARRGEQRDEREGGG